MHYSLCLSHILKIARESEAVADAWLKTHCLGVLTMFDKTLEYSSKLKPEEYNARAAELLTNSLTCAWATEEWHSPTAQFDWVAVLNPNPREMEANMGFAQAYQKESWFFDHLLGP